jgi:[protein-PII] uridylyltransferase
LALSDLSLREPEPKAIAEFASIAGDLENLNLLFLLTVLDIRTVGNHTWTAWKAFQLEHLYAALAAALRNPATHLHTSPALAFSYEHEVLAADRARHARWLAELSAAKPVSFHLEEFGGFQRVTVCGRDRLGFLADIAACFSSEGYDILSARIYSTSEGKIIDVFHLSPPPRPDIPATKRLAAVETKWGRITDGTATAQSLIAERLTKYPLELRAAHGGEPQVTVNNDASLLYTIIEIKSHDNFALMYRIARCLSANRINIHSARLTTRIDLAVDLFYVTGHGGAKITDQQEIAELAKTLAIAAAESSARCT